MEIPETTPTVENDAEEIRPTENESVSEGEDLTAELDDEPVDSFIDLPRGQALTTSEASQISSAKRSQLIVIAGEVKSGKTTLLTSLFHCFQKGPFSGYMFAGSKTLVGFDLRCFYARTACEKDRMDTARTIPGAKDQGHQNHLTS